MMHGSDVGWGMGFGWLFMVLFWALAVFGIAHVVQWFAWKAGKPVPERPPAISRQTPCERNDHHGRKRTKDG